MVRHLRKLSHLARNVVGKYTNVCSPLRLDADTVKDCKGSKIKVGLKCMVSTRSQTTTLGTSYLYPAFLGLNKTLQNALHTHAR